MEDRLRISDGQLKVDVYQYLIDNSPALVEMLNPSVSVLVGNKSLYKANPGFLKAYRNYLNDFILITLSDHVAQSLGYSVDRVLAVTVDVPVDLFDLFFEETLYGR